MGVVRGPMTQAAVICMGLSLVCLAGLGFRVDWGNEGVGNTPTVHHSGFMVGLGLIERNGGQRSDIASIVKDHMDPKTLNPPNPEPPNLNPKP